MRASNAAVLCRVVLAVLVSILMSAEPVASRADGTLISAASRIDMVHNMADDTVYITNGSTIARYVVGTNAVLPSITIDGGAAKLMGIDLSPDGNTLAVADNRTANGLVWIWLVDVSSQTVTKITFPEAFYEGGTFTVAFGADGSVFITGTFLGSGWVPLRRYDPSTNTTTVVLSMVDQNTMLTPSGDANIIGFAEANSSTGPVGRIRVSDGNVILYDDYAGGTSWFNYEIGTNHDGSQFAVPTYNGAYIYDGSVVKTGKIVGTYAGPQPIGAVYHPVENIVYFPWAGTYDVYAFDSTTWTQTADYNFQNFFDHPGNNAFVEGRLKISRDGSILFCTVSGGVRFIKLYAGLVASDLDVTLDEGTSAKVTLGGSIGNSGALTWSIETQPAHGAVTGAGQNVTYTPTAGYSGTDSFTYRVSYGRAFKIGTVHLTINATGHPPIAVNDSASTANGAPVTVDVLGNDSDPDNDPLTVIAVTQGANGSVAINPNNTVTYTPQLAFNGTDSFTYTIDDGTGRTATATVTITSVYDTSGLLYSLSVSRSTIPGGATAKGTVRLSQAISLPIDVALNCTNPAVSVPATVRVPAGSVTAALTITTTAVSTKTTGTLSATLGATTKSVAITVRPVSVQSVSFSPSSVVGGHGSTGKVTLEAPAGPGDVTVTLSSLSTLVRVTDASGNALSQIVIPAGATTGAFYVQTDPVAAVTKAKVRATANGLYKDGTLTLKPIPVASITVSPTSVQGGKLAIATITLVDPAAPGDVTVALASSAPGMAWFIDQSGGNVSSVVVPAGAYGVSLYVQTVSVAAKTAVKLSAAAGGVTKSTTLTLTP